MVCETGLRIADRYGDETINSNPLGSGYAYGETIPVPDQPITMSSYYSCFYTFLQ